MLLSGMFCVLKHLEQQQLAPSTAFRFCFGSHMVANLEPPKGGFNATEDQQAGSGQPHQRHCVG